MIKLLLKFATTSGIFSSIFFVDFSSTNSLKKEKEDFEKNNEKISEIKNLNDIELFEKENNCFFGFVDKWDSKEVYKVSEFLKKYSGTDWEKRAIWGANTFRNDCKSKRQVTLFYGGSNGKFGLDTGKFNR